MDSMERRLNEWLAGMDRQLSELHVRVTDDMAALLRDLDVLTLQQRRPEPSLAAMATVTLAIESPRAFGRDITASVPQIGRRPRLTIYERSLLGLEPGQRVRLGRRRRENLWRMNIQRERQALDNIGPEEIDENGLRKQNQRPLSSTLETDSWICRAHDHKTPRPYRKGDERFVVYESPGGET